jgi:hypothetical protein
MKDFPPLEGSHICDEDLRYLRQTAPMVEQITWPRW